MAQARAIEAQNGSIVPALRSTVSAEQDLWPAGQCMRRLARGSPALPVNTTHSPCLRSPVLRCLGGLQRTFRLNQGCKVERGLLGVAKDDTAPSNTSLLPM